MIDLPSHTTRLPTLPRKSIHIEMVEKQILLKMNVNKENSNNMILYGKKKQKKGEVSGGSSLDFV